MKYQTMVETAMIKTAKKWIGAVLLVLMAGGWLSAAEGETGTAAAGKSETGGFEQAQLISKAFRDTSKAVLPSVVKIVIRSGEDQADGGKEKSAQNRLPFGDIYPDWTMDEMDEAIEGIGSGVVVDPNGTVLTNHHVVTDSTNIQVELYDGRKFGVQNVKKDPLSDLAVLILDREEGSGPLPSLTFADSDLLEIGDWVLAIGNPFMLDSSVSAGIVSAKGRSLGKGERGSFIQTDAAINPGNSGGPLVNLRGEIVGINTAIASLSGGYQGIGFAIPSNTAQWVMNQLIEKEKVDRAFLGAVFEPIAYPEAQRLGLGPNCGVKTRLVYRNTPASEAGLKGSDIILEFDRKTIDSIETLQGLIESADITADHQLTILRKGDAEHRQLTVRLVVASDDFVGVPQTENLVKEGKHFRDSLLGMMLIPLTEDSANRLGVNADSGLVVLSVTPALPAWQAGLRDGMCIVAVNSEPIASVEDFETKIKESAEVEIRLDVFVKGKNQTLVLKK